MRRKVGWLPGALLVVGILALSWFLWDWWRLMSSTEVLYQGIARYKEADYAAANDLLDQSFERSRRVSGRHLWRGAVLFHLDRPSEAVREFEMELAENPQENRASNGLGAAVCAVGRYDEAIPPLKEVVKAYPYRPVYRHNLAIASKGAGRTREAAHEAAYARRFSKGASVAWHGPIVMEIDVGIR